MLRPYQEEAIEKVEEAWEEGIRDPSVDIFCGLGKSIILDHLLDGSELQAIVMPSLSLVQQFCSQYLAGRRHMAFCTLGESDEGVAIGTTDLAVATEFSNHPGIYAVTYKSLPKLLECVRNIRKILFDEAHHVAEEANAYIKALPAQVAYFSATPDKDVGTEVFRFSYFDALMSDPQYSQDFQIKYGDYTDERTLLGLIERTAEKTGNKRILTFHSKVNGESETSVRNFARAATAYFGDRATVAYMDADTPMEERVRLLERLYSTPDDQIFLLASCETIGEGVDTKRCNHIVFVDPVKSYVKIVQKLGRCVRRQENGNPSTVLIPIFPEQAKYEACSTAEERDALIRSEYSERGDFNPVFNFLCAVRESDPDLLYLILSNQCLPAARLEHYRRIGGDVPRVPLEEAVEQLTGERTDDVEGAAQRAQRTIEVHDRDGDVTQYGGEAAVDSIVEMEPDAYVAVRGGVPRPPKKKRLEFIESPFLLSIDLEKAIIDYEVRPSVFQEHVDQVTAFVSEHGRLPKIREDNGTWINHQRKAYRKGKLSPERIQTLGEIPLWTWGEALEDAFEKAVTEVTAFVAEHGRLPKQGEKNGTWICGQRQAYRKGKLSPERIQTLGEIPLWTWGEAFEDAFEKAVTEVTAFVAEHGRLPKQGEKNGTWISHQRQAYRKGKLSPERIQTLGEIPLWTWGALEDAFEKAVTEVTSFVSEHGRLPMRREDNGKWIGHQRIAYRKGELSPERIQTLGEIPLWTWVGRASTKSATSEESDETPLQDEAHATSDRPEPTGEAPRQRATPEEHRRRILETMTPEEMADQLARGRTRGYTAPNPKDKDEINALFARSLPDEGLVVFLDHTDFKTARAVGDREMLIPQRDRAAFDEMHADPTYGRYVKFGDFTQLVRGIKRPIGGIYADFTGPLKTGLEFVEACKEVEFAPKAVVGVTIAMRNPEGNDSYTNAAVEKLSTAMSDKLDVVSIDGPVEPMYYGTGMPMVTVMKKRRT
jgi:superfamily II DNA or RNA helicase